MLPTPIAARPLIRLALVVGMLGSLVSCGSAPDQQEPPPPLVVVEALKGQSIPSITELPGRIEAMRTAEVRARVDGIVQKRLYEEGSDVREGAPLFQIDPREKQAELQQAEAALRRMVATRINAAQVVKRFTPLVERKAVSAQEFDAATAALRQAEADVAQAQATVDNARLALSYTTVRAPLAGRAGRAAVTEGALVSAASATLMTRVDQLSPIYATFSESNANILDFQRGLQSGALKAPAFDRIEVRLVLEDGSEYGPTGHLDFAELSVDPSTGGQILRARFPNAQRALLPGQFVRGRITAGVMQNGISIPQRAVAISDEETSVMLVGADDTATARPVELGALIDGRWVVRSGLKPGDRIITEGWQKVRPGQKVRVKTPAAKAVPPSPTPR